MKNFVKIATILGITFLMMVQCKKGIPSASEGEFKIDGKLAGLSEGTLYLQKNINGEKVAIDSVQLKNQEQFSFKGKIDHPDVYWLQVKGNIPMAIFLEPGKGVAFRAHIDSIQLYKAYGIETQKDLSRFSRYIYSRDVAYNDYEQAYLVAKQNNDTYGAESWAVKMENNRRSRTNLALNFAIRNPKTQIAPWIGINYLAEAQPRYLDTLYSKMNDSIKKTYYGKEFKKYLDGMHRTKVGNSVSKLALKDINGKALNFPVLGKKTVLYFWKTSDVVSRGDVLLLSQNTNPNAVIYAVNLDSDANIVKKIPEFKSITLPIVFDKVGIESVLAQTFAVRQTPSSMIIDENGKILALGVSASEIATLIGQ